MSSNRPSTQPAQSLVVLASDLLAAAVESMMRELAGADKWPAALRVRSALEAYSAARQGDILTDPDPQRCQINPAPSAEGDTRQ